MKGKHRRQHSRALPHPRAFQGARSTLAYLDSFSGDCAPKTLVRICYELGAKWGLDPPTIRRVLKPFTQQYVKHGPKARRRLLSAAKVALWQEASGR